MNNMEAAHEECKESPPNTIELLTSLFEDSKEPKIRRVKGNSGPARQTMRHEGFLFKRFSSILCPHSNSSDSSVG
jgi:hypothetical protein